MSVGEGDPRQLRILGQRRRDRLSDHNRFGPKRIVGSGQADPAFLPQQQSPAEPDHGQQQADYSAGPAVEESEQGH